jgi:hypothetical protein
MKKANQLVIITIKISHMINIINRLNPLTKNWLIIILFLMNQPASTQMQP